MFRDPDRHPHLRAIIALHQIFGGKAESIIPFMNRPGAAKLLDRTLLVTAGDMGNVLDFNTLRPLALKYRFDVLGTYCDEQKWGHRFQFDLVLNRTGKTRTFEAYRLWLATGGGAFFVPESGAGPAFSAMTPRLSIVKRPPFRTAAERMLGIARGEAELLPRIYPAQSFGNAHGRFAKY